MTAAGEGWFDRQGRPLRTYEEIEPLLADPDYKRVARTVVGPHEVSTVWLGLDHGFRSAVPLIFETLVFPECEICYRYPTEAAALAGHDQVCAELRDEQAAVLRLMAEAEEAKGEEP